MNDNWARRIENREMGVFQKKSAREKWKVIFAGGMEIAHVSSSCALHPTLDGFH